MSEMTPDSPRRVECATIRYQQGFTDFLVAVDGIPVGYFTLSLGGGAVGDPSFGLFAIGQTIVPGTEANYEGNAIRIINDRQYVLNAIYQFNRTDEFAKNPVLTVDELGAELLAIFARDSGVTVPIDQLCLMATGPMIVEPVNGKIHYMVGDIVFGKGDAPK